MASAIRRVSSCVVAAIVVASFAVHTGRAQTWSPPRTPWGDPDLQGIWNYATMTPLERPRDVADKDAFTDDEAAAYEQRTNHYQASPSQGRRSSPSGRRQKPKRRKSKRDRGIEARVAFFFSAVFVSSAGATSMRTLHPTPIEAQPSRSKGQESETLAA
jgi:hypothetical protein